jgi:hypothetical protein
MRLVIYWHLSTDVENLLELAVQFTRPVDKIFVVRHASLQTRNVDKIDSSLVTVQ